MNRRCILLLGLGLVLLCAAGCQSPARHLQKVNRAAAEIIAEKQLAALGREEPFTVVPAVDRLRRKLLLGGQLPFTAGASLGSRDLEKIGHWPPGIDPPEVTVPPWEEGAPLQLSLLEALQVAARNSRTYQSAKEEVFLAALALDLARNDFRSIYAGQLESELRTDRSGDPTISGSESSALARAERLLQTGAALSAQIGLDLVKLLTLDRSSSLGLFADASVSIPLLRGAGRHIAAEPLTQAERNTIYAIWEFERFKRSFAVSIASSYLGVLQQLDQVKNAEENYRRLINGSRRGRRLADAGRLPEIQVDQAIQEELRARDRWVAANQTFSRRLDEFKISLGLPVDAALSLDRGELEKLTVSAKELLNGEKNAANVAEDMLPADAPIILAAPGQGRPGPYEMEESSAIGLALGNRLDLRIALAQVSDAQRAVVVAADSLRAELTLLGSASAGERRTLASADLPDAKLRPDEGRYAALLSLDLPWERTAERLAFRQAIIDVEEAVRNLQAQEDGVKFEIRNGLRDLVEAREGIRIQAQAVTLAERRVKSSALFLQAGRAQVRDLLEAQDALISAQDALSQALVDYRIAELELQRDLGLLQVDHKGLWTEHRGATASAQTPEPTADYQEPAEPFSEQPTPTMKPNSAPAAQPAEQPAAQQPKERPGLKIGAIRYDKRSRDSFAIVNGEPVRQGSVIEGAKVERILEDRIRFRFRGETFELPARDKGTN